MNAVQSVRHYVDKMIQDAGPGMKILLMDKETTSVISNVYSQTEIMTKEVYLCDRLDNMKNREPLHHLKCLVFLRPTVENVTYLCMELKNPMYGSYYLHWTNIISKSEVKRLAEADEQELVREISECFADFIPINSHTFITNTPHGHIFTGVGDILKEPVVVALTQAVISFLLASKRLPYIRYTDWSRQCEKLAERLASTMDKERHDKGLFSFTQPRIQDGSGQALSRPVILILDRRDDCVTPILNQWTYQAMVHELLTIKNQRVSLADAPDIPKDFREVVLSASHDSFFAENLYADFGMVGQNLRQLVEEFQNKAKSQQKVESIDDMKTFIENYPHFKQMSGTVSKHVVVVGELARLNEKYSLLEVSELEQEIACHSNHSSSLQSLQKLLSNVKVRDRDCLRLALLYALKFETHSNNDITGLIRKLKTKGLPDEDVNLVKAILRFGGVKKRKSDLFGSHPVAVTKRFMKGLKGVENIYTQHTPWLKTVLDDIRRGKLREDQYPYYAKSQDYAPPMNELNFRASEVIVFILGGITYAESLVVHNINRLDGRTAVVLGGTQMHNMNSFLEEIRASMAKHQEH